MFGCDDVDVLQAIGAAHPGALITHLRLKELRRDHRVNSSALDLLAVGVLILNAEGRVLFANSSAQRLLAAGDSLRFTADGF